MRYLVPRGKKSTRICATNLSKHALLRVLLDGITGLLGCNLELFSAKIDVDDKVETQTFSHSIIPKGGKKKEKKETTSAVRTW